MSDYKILYYFSRTYQPLTLNFVKEMVRSLRLNSIFEVDLFIPVIYGVGDILFYCVVVT